jgi:hypothetical protein
MENTEHNEMTEEENKGKRSRKIYKCLKDD